MNKKTSSVFLVLIFFTTFPCLAWPWSGMVVGVTDGNTIKVMGSHNKQMKILLYGIDTPEKGQAFGKKAKQFASDMVSARLLKLTPSQ